MKNELIQIRVTQNEKKRLQNKSDEAGISLSHYLLCAADKSLDLNINSSLAKKLCMLANIINKIDSKENAEELRKWSEDVWQLLK